MKWHKWLLVLPLALLLAGCEPVDSLSPLYTDKDVVFDEALLGQWESEGEGLNFAKLGDDGYRIVMTQKDNDTGQVTTLVFDGHLLQLQDHRFLDVVRKQSEPLGDSQAMPDVKITRTGDGLEIEPRLVRIGKGAYLELLAGESENDQDRFSLRPRQAHQFFQVVMEDEGRTLKLVQLDDSWIARQIDDGGLVIGHETVDGDSIVLTATTPELQQLVLDHVDDEEAFRGETIVHRPDPGSR